MQPRLRDRQRGVALVTAVPNSSEIVTLERRGPRTHIVPPIAEIEDVFATTIHFPVRDRRHGTEIVKVPLPLVWNSTGDDGETVQFCLAGLEPMIATWLSRRGIKTKRTGARPPLPEQHVYAWTDLAPDPAFINFISTNDRGLIQCVSGAQKAWLIAQAALAWPTQTVVVWAIRVKEAEELAEQLLRWLPTEQVAILTGQHALQRKARVVVATSKYLADVRLRFRTRDLGFALSPEQIFDKDGRYLIQHICHTRFYGFWNDWPSSPYLRDFLTAFFRTGPLRSAAAWF